MNASRCFCGASEIRQLFFSGAFDIVACLRCGQARTVTPKFRTRTQEYQESDIRVYLEKEAMFRGLFRNVLSFIRRFIRHGIFLEIGAGVGLLVDEAGKAGFTAYGCEPSAAAVRAANRHFGVQLMQAEFSRRTWNRRTDVVILNHVLEHLPDPIAVIRDVHAVLKPDGFLIIGVPNFGSFLAQAKQARWQSLIPDQHRWHFTKNSLDRLVVPQGFQRVGLTSENHDRSMHPLWKRPFYAILDTISRGFGNGEAILVAYRKTA